LIDQIGFENVNFHTFNYVLNEVRANLAARKRIEHAPTCPDELSDFLIRPLESLNEVTGLNPLICRSGDPIAELVVV
jgi:hypothetical protein